LIPERVQPRGAKGNGSVKSAERHTLAIGPVLWISIVHRYEYWLPSVVWLVGVQPRLVQDTDADRATRMGGRTPIAILFVGTHLSLPSPLKPGPQRYHLLPCRYCCHFPYSLGPESLLDIPLR